MTSTSGKGKPAISLPTDGETSPEIRKTLALLPPLNAFRMMAQAPASFQAFVDLALSVLIKSEFDARKREIAVLRVAHRTGSRYVWTQHVTVGKRAGLNDDEIAKIATEGSVTSLDEEGNLLCRVADEITCDIRLSDAALAAIVSRYGERQATELILCCSYFNMLARFLESTRVELEGEPVLEKMD
jgi:alkylhydroperoxidase family enzyme